MAKYEKDIKFYWLQLKEDFFEDDAISWLEDQQPNGRDYAYFYLKLCLKALKSNGILIRKVGTVLIPYDNKKLAELTKMDFDTVVVAMELLKQIGLIKILENGEIYIEQLEQLIGSKSLGAFKKQQQRALNIQIKLQGGQEVDICPPDIDKELELENITIHNITLLFNYLNKEKENFSKEERILMRVSDNEIAGVINQLKKYDLYIDNIDIIKYFNPELLLRHKILYWVIKELYRSPYRAYLDKLNKANIDRCYYSAIKYKDKENIQDFIGYLIKCLYNEMEKMI